MLDLSIMFERPCAILLDSSDKAKELFAAIHEANPEITSLWSEETDENRNWDVYGEETCFTLYNDNYDGELVLDKLRYSPRSYYEENGYEIVDFNELLGEELELEESDIPLEEFLGI